MPKWLSTCCSTLNPNPEHCLFEETMKEILKCSHLRSRMLKIVDISAWKWPKWWIDCSMVASSLFDWLIFLSMHIFYQDRNMNGCCSCSTDILQIVLVGAPFFLPHYNPREGRLMGRKKKHHIKSDQIVSLMEQFVSQFCQNHAFAELPRVWCLQAIKAIRHHLFYPRYPLLHQHDCGYIYRRPVILSFCPASWFTMIDISLSNEEWCAFSNCGIARRLHLCRLIQGHVSQSVRRCEASLSKKTD